MKKIAQGLPLKKYIGNKHKDGGIMVNALGNKTKDVNKAVAEVEGGEYNFRYNPNNPKDNYILSEQLGIAGIAKQADRFKGNNRIDYNTRTNLLNKSMKLNEMLRVQQEQQQPMQMALGGGLNNNPFDKQPPKQKDSDFRKTYQSTPMNVAKMFDPTGISSYPDVAYSIDDYNKGKGSKSDIALNVLGALPIIGKAKGLITLAKGTSKTKKGLNTITKLGDLAGDIERFPLQTAKDLTNNATKPIAKLVNKSATNLLNFNDVIRNTIVPPLNPKRIPTKSATKSDMINAGTSLVNIGNLGSDINSVSKKQFGGKLKKYINGGLTKGSQSIVDSMVANSKANDTTKIATAPEIKLGTAMPLSYSDKLITNPLDLNLNKSKEQSLTKLPTTAPKTTAEAANTGMQVNTQNNATPEPTINKKGVKDVTSGLSSVASAFGPIGQAVGMGIQLAPYAIDLGKAMFDKTSVQDLQTQGSAMRLPNTTYAKNGGKLNVKPLPKFEDGGEPNKLSRKEKRKLAADTENRWKNLSKDGIADITEFEDLLGLSVKDKQSNFNTSNITPVVQPSLTQTKPLKIKTKLEIDKKSLAGDKSYLDKKFTTPNYIDYAQEKADEISRTNAGVTDKMYRSLSKFFNTPADFDPYFKSNSLNVKPNSLNFTSVNPSIQQSLTQANPLEIKLGKAMPLSFLDGSTKSNLITNPLDLNYNPRLTKRLNVTKLPTTTPKTVSEAVNLGLKLNTQTNSTPEPVIETPKPSKEVKSLSEQLYDRGQKKQKLSEALMYGMAALPSEQIKTITPDYGRGDDAMSRMGLSTEPIRQEMMQGANKALELTRSQVGTAGQLQSRGQSIMSNVGNQLAQSQMQQQQYLNQLRGALAQREDTKANVLAQSQLTAREAKSAERAAKLDQLNNAISQTSAIGAGTMEQASKMSTIENENERFNKQQERLLDIFNKSGNFKVSFDKDGKITYDYVGNTPAQSNIQTSSLATTPAANNAANNGTNTIPASNAVVPVTTTGTTHTIKKGDTLYAIAKANNTTVSNLVKLNGFKNDRALILPGQTIKIK